MKRKLISTYILSILLFLITFYLTTRHPGNGTTFVFFIAALISMIVLTSMIGKRKLWSELSKKEKIGRFIPALSYIITTIFLYNFGRHIPIRILLAVAYGIIVYLYIDFGYKIYKKLKNDANESGKD